MLKFLIILCTASCAFSAQLKCVFDRDVVNYDYECVGRVIISRRDSVIDTVSGRHVAGKGNDDLTLVVIRESSLEVLPSNLKRRFRNFIAFAIDNIEILDHLTRSELKEFSHLKLFRANNVPLITSIDRDAFYDLTELKDLQLNEMVNLRSLDADLLINSRQLAYLSVQGPNKITQISPGFFRNQGNSLEVVNFSNTNILRIGYTVFDGLKSIKVVSFSGGCLNDIYVQVVQDIVHTLSVDIRKQCEDVSARRNAIVKKQIWDAYSSSSESNEGWNKKQGKWRNH